MQNSDSPLRRIFVVTQILAIVWTFVTVAGEFMRLYQSPEQWSFTLVMGLLAWFFLFVALGWVASYPFVMSLLIFREEGKGYLVSRIGMYVGVVVNIIYIGLAIYIFVRWLSGRTLSATDLCVVLCSPAPLLALVYLLRVPTD